VTAPASGVGRSEGRQDPERAVTPFTAWTEALARHRPRRFDTSAHQRVVVLAAHPDDETLGAAGCLQSLHRDGAELSLIVATDGEAAFPSLPAPNRVSLGRRRRRELTASLQALGLSEVSVHWLGLPDSELAANPDVLRAALTPLLADADAYLAPWPMDPHPDHRAVALAAAAAAPVTAHGWSYPIWMWAWTSPDDAELRWDRAYQVELDTAARTAKRTAVACFASQLSPGPHGQPPVLPPALLEHVDRDVELFFREPRRGGAPIQRFVELYADGRDPWRAGSWYERRKRAVVLACLPRDRYDAAFEPGCGTGELTLDLAERCTRVFASDPVTGAVERARALTTASAGVQVLRNALPAAVPGGPIDLAVFSEVLYYLDEDTLDETVRRTLSVLQPGGDLVAVHWRGWPPEAPRDAATTHALLRARPELVALVEHRDEDFELVVLRRQ
jgi:LmbE family N-acetylglucosaminyl deacetylase